MPWMLIYVCDDEIPILDRIAARISDCMPEDEVTVFQSGGALLNALAVKPCDILFLDIDMPDRNGMETAYGLNGLEHKPLLVFVTNHDELVYESFQYHPFGFIRKKFFDQEIGTILEDCRKELNFRTKHFCFRMNGQETAVLLSDILYFESDGNYLKLSSVSGQYRFRSTILAAEEQLKTDGFIRIHKGFLVNRSAVRMIGKEELELVNKDKLPLGEKYADSAKREILQYMRTLMR